MSALLTRILLLFALLGAASALAACGQTEQSGEFEAVEGEALELGELSYNVQITRYLNRDDPEDAAYLQGTPLPKPGSEYLGVFMRIQNDSEDETLRIPGAMRVRDTRNLSFYPVETESNFALELPSEIGPKETIPGPNTPAGAGPIKGTMVLFEIPRTSAENRPLELELLGPEGELGMIELDL